MTVHAKPNGADLVAKLIATRHHCDDRTELLLWMIDFMQRLRAAQDRFETDASLVEYAGRLEFDSGWWLDDLQQEWRRLRLALRIASRERSHE